MRTVLVGEVKTAEYALRGLVRANCAPELILTTDVDRVHAKSGMSYDYYARLGDASQDEGIPIQVIRELDDAVAELIEAAADYIFVMGWPYLVSGRILDIAPCIGMHPTRLPERRGGAPLNWLLIDGEQAGAVTLFRLRSGLDDGEIAAQAEFPIGQDDYVGDVLDVVYGWTEQLVLQVACALPRGHQEWHPQDSSRATYTRRRTPSDGQISWRDSAVRIRNAIRAQSHPFPGAFSRLERWTVKIWRAEVPLGVRAPLRARPGEILTVDELGVLVATSDNALLISDLEVIDENGHSELSSEALAPYVGERFE